MAPPKKGDEGSVVDGLKAVYQDISSLNLAPDAGQYAQLIQGLQQAVLKMIQGIAQQKAQQAAQMQQMQAQRAMNPQMGGAGPGGPQAGGPSPGAPPGGPGGPPSQGSPGMAMPNPDELRRVLAAQGKGG